jgi:hypothetical protein
MVNYVVDLRAHAPRGFEVIPHDPAEPPRRLVVYLGGYMDAFNEDVAIALLVPTVAKEDFNLMAAVIKDYFIHTHRVRLMEVQPYAMGDAYIRFNSVVERERFLDGIYQITPEYQMHFVKHDEAINARAHDAWLGLCSLTILLMPRTTPVWLLTVKIGQPSHEITFGVGMTFVSYSLVLTPVV